VNRFNLDDYEPVASRVQRFYDKHPNGSIICALVYDDGTRCVVQATVWRDLNDSAPAAVDYAEELLTERGVNATSRIENCATSAIGRAISVASAGLGPSDWTKKPSREEMAKVQRRDTGDAPREFIGTKTITNKMKGTCIKCHAKVEVGEGLATNDGSGWKTMHKDGECKEEAF